MADYLRSEQTRRDRARGVLLAAACGNALVDHEPGEYSDAVQMQVVMGRVAAGGADLRTEEALRAVADGFLDWAASGATEVGGQTRAGLLAGNGSLMRTSLLALAYLNDRQALAEAARAVSSLTHDDPLAGEACVLWCEAVRMAVLYGTGDGGLPQSPALGLDLLDGDAARPWRGWLDQAAEQKPRAFAPSGYVVPALQAAWSAVHSVPIPEDNPGRHLGRALYAAVRVGDDTDAVAAIAGALLGAHWGASSVYPEWQRAVRGWPGLRAADLAALCDAIVDTHGGFPDDDA